VLQDEIAAARDARRDHRNNVTFGRSEQVAFLDVPGWMNTRLQELLRVMQAAMTALNKELPVAMGTPGVAGDAAHLAYVARVIGRCYGEAIEWAFRIRRAHVD